MEDPFGKLALLRRSRKHHKSAKPSGQLIVTTHCSSHIFTVNVLTLKKSKAGNFSKVSNIVAPETLCAPTLKVAFVMLRMSPNQICKASLFWIVASARQGATENSFVKCV